MMRKRKRGPGLVVRDTAGSVPLPLLPSASSLCSECEREIWGPRHDAPKGSEETDTPNPAILTARRVVRGLGKRTQAL